MANNILLISWISEAYWSYNYLLVIILLLIISILLYRIRKLQKTIKKTNHSYRFSFDILDNLPFPIFVKDITNDFRYYYWNKESAVQSGIQGRRIKNYCSVKVVTNIFHPIRLLVFSDSYFLLLFYPSLVW